MYYLDLFSGIGGFALGAYWAGWRFDEHYFSEIDSYCVDLYMGRFPQAVPLGDITKIDDKTFYPLMGKVGIITGGFPCQDISIAGKGEGISGERSGLWFEMWRIIRDLQPRWVIAENVGAITFRGLSTVINSLAEIGYDAEWQDIRASDMGAPHKRERIWIVAYPCNKLRDDGVLQEGCFAITEKREETVRCPHWGESPMESTPSEILRGWTGTTICESPLVRMDDGISNIVDRLKALGNSIVPQIAELLFRRIKEIELSLD